ncbi:MAG: ABC-2 family transporter protein [Caldilineaceae bacterium]
MPAYLAALWLFGIDLPASPVAAVGFVLSLGGAFLLVFAFDFFIGLLSFWTFSVWGLTYAKIAVTDILAGTLIPLTLFPGWLRSIALLPFRDGLRHFRSTPARLKAPRSGQALPASWHGPLCSLG